MRILSLGDSFTAGYRLGQDETYSFLVESFLNEKGDGKKYQVLVSCIEEPATGLYYFQKFGASYRPQLVLLGITLGNDFAQVYLSLDPKGQYSLDSRGLITKNSMAPTLGFRHGLETKLIPSACLQPDHHESLHHESLFDRFVTVQILSRLFEVNYSGEAIETWYGDRKRPRLFDASNGLGQYLSRPPEEITESYNRLFRVLVAFDLQTRQRGSKLIVVLFPQRFQVQPEDWTRTKEVYALKEACFDLGRPNEMIHEFCKRNGITCVDPLPAMSAIYMRTHRNLFHSNGDMHPNSFGNRALFEAIREPITSALTDNVTPREYSGT